MRLSSSLAPVSCVGSTIDMITESDSSGLKAL